MSTRQDSPPPSRIVSTPRNPPGAPRRPRTTRAARQHERSQTRPSPPVKRALFAPLPEHPHTDDAWQTQTSRKGRRHHPKKHHDPFQASVTRAHTEPVLGAPRHRSHTRKSNFAVVFSEKHDPDDIIADLKGKAGPDNIIVAIAGTIMPPGADHRVPVLAFKTSRATDINDVYAWFGRPGPKITYHSQFFSAVDCLTCSLGLDPIDRKTSAVASNSDKRVADVENQLRAYFGGTLVAFANRPKTTAITRAASVYFGESAIAHRALCTLQNTAPAHLDTREIINYHSKHGNTAKYFPNFTHSVTHTLAAAILDSPFFTTEYKGTRKRRARNVKFDDKCFSTALRLSGALLDIVRGYGTKGSCI